MGPLPKRLPFEGRCQPNRLTEGCFADMRPVTPLSQNTFCQLPSRGAFGISRLVKTRIFAQIRPCGKNYDGRKSGKAVEGCRFVLCKSGLHIHTLPKLWKTPVEKPVENVENFEFSTGIPFVSPGAPACGKVCIGLCIIPPTGHGPSCYVTAVPAPGWVYFRRKSWDVVKKCCQKPLPPGAAKIFFVKNRQNKWLYHPAPPGNTFPIRFFRRSTCREK